MPTPAPSGGGREMPRRNAETGGWQTGVTHGVPSVSKRLCLWGMHWDHGGARRGGAFPSGTALRLLAWAVSGMSGECGGCGAPQGVLGVP